MNTKVQLNHFLARDLKIDFGVVAEIFIDQGLVLPELETLVEKENPAIQVELINKRISE